MGQKTNPVGLRLQINRTWDSRWFAEGQDYGRLLLEDLKIRKHIMKILPQAAISKVVIERPAKLCRISIYAARPGVIIGKKGSDIEKLKKTLSSMTSSDVSLNIVEIRKPEVDARLVAQGVADQLERRIAFRRAMKKAMESAFRFGANFEWLDPAPKTVITGKIEFDFEGNFTRANNRNISSIRSSQPSIRLAWARIDRRLSENVTGFALFGQDWTPFVSSTLPNTIENTNFGGLGYGAAYERAPQARFGSPSTAPSSSSETPTRTCAPTASARSTRRTASRRRSRRSRRPPPGR